MPKIRDLGITALPGTMRPLEIGFRAADAGGARKYWLSTEKSAQGCCVPSAPPPKPGCSPSEPPPKPPGCQGNSAPPKYAGAFSNAAIAQLTQQLHQRLGTN